MKSYYSEEELLNTFKPVFECLKLIHDNGIVHGSLSKDCIVFGEKGDIGVRDWLA